MEKEHFRTLTFHMNTSFFYKQKELFRNADNVYESFDRIKAYDCNGIYIGKVDINNERETVYSEVTKPNRNCLNVIQLDYDFLVLEFPNRITTQDELRLFTRCLNDSDFNKTFEDSYKIDFCKRDEKYQFNHLKLIEINKLSTSLMCHAKQGRNIIEFNLFKYKENLDKFILENKDKDYLIDEAKYLYYKNVELITKYFDCTEKELMKPNFINLFISRIKKKNMKL
jgi:hypothetical protein